MPRKIVSYLHQLRFDPRLKDKWWAKYIVNTRLVLLLVVSIIALGGYSFFTIPRRLNPEVKIPIVIVSTVMPGSSPSDIESLITIPVEDKLNNIKGLDSMVSVSQENVSVVTMQFVSNVDGDKALQDVKSAVDSVAGLPEDAMDPAVQLLDFEDQPVWTFVVTSKSDTASLMRFSKELKEKIEDISKVDRVTTAGFETQEVQVIVDPVKINEYGISPVQLSQLVQKSTASYPAGAVQTTDFTFALGINKDILSIADLRSMRLTAQGRTFYLSDVATVIERSKNNQPKTYVMQKNIDTPQRAVQFFVYKSKSSNIDEAEKQVHAEVDKIFVQHNGQFQLITVMNTAEEIEKQFTDLFGEFGSTIFLVFMLLLVFLGFRQAVISSLTVPLTFLASLTIMNQMGLSLNFLTLFAFLLSLGLLIDDTIVTVAAMTRYYRTGKFTASETGMLVWRDFIVPLWSTTITTIWAFLPLLISTGIIGEFIKSIPIVVTATMLSSTSIAVLITLPLMIVFLQPQIPNRVKVLLLLLVPIAVVSIMGLFLPKSPFYLITLIALIICIFIIFQIRKALAERITYIRTSRRYGSVLRKVNTGFVNIEGLSERYKDIIDRILFSKTARRSTIIFIVIFALIGYALVPLGFVKSEFFPKTDEDIIYIQVELPAGTNLETTNKEVLSFMEQVKNTPETNFIVADTGANFNSDFNRNEDPASFLITLHLHPDEERKTSSIDIAEDLREQFKGYKKGEVSVIELSGGPPAGADIQVSLLGEEFGTLDKYANQVVTYLEKQPGVANVKSSNKASTSKLVFIPDERRMAELQLTPDMLGLWLRTFASGFTLDTIKINGEDTDITFLMEKKAQTPESIGEIMVPLPSGTVQLLSLGKVQLENNPTSIVRENQKRRLTVTAAATQGASATEKNTELLKYTESIDLPEGYSWETGGVNEENTKSVQSILQAMLLSALLILVTMVIEFGSFRQTLIALLIIPLAVSGVFYVFALTGTPLSFPALIGILALFGIVVTHAIVVIEKINDNRKHGMKLHDSLVDAAGSRLEPVLLTSLATIVGLIPITIADPLWRGLGGAIIAGLLFSGVIKLFFVPVMYYNWFQSDEKKEILRKANQRLHK